MFYKSIYLYGRWRSPRQCQALPGTLATIDILQALPLSCRKKCIRHHARCNVRFKLGNQHGGSARIGTANPKSLCGPGWQLPTDKFLAASIPRRIGYLGTILRANREIHAGMLDLPLARNGDHGPTPDWPARQSVSPQSFEGIGLARCPHRREKTQNWRREQGA